MYGGTELAGAYQSIGLAGISDSVFVTGAGQELRRLSSDAGSPSWICRLGASGSLPPISRLVYMLIFLPLNPFAGAAPLPDREVGRQQFY
ncbi:hypothetical protein XI01_03105 [Bradyrhizobium sp. CCBAU 21360]|nr:hypothetical protein [Bradyrhizobium sp. CCBAU 21360]